MRLNRIDFIVKAKPGLVTILKEFRLVFKRHRYGPVSLILSRELLCETAFLA